MSDYEGKLVGVQSAEELHNSTGPVLQNRLGMRPSVAAHVFNEDYISRPISAPPVVTHAFESPQHQRPQYDVDSAEAFRADPAYCKWYYAQNPRDPRLPPPIIRPQPQAAHAPPHPTTQAPLPTAQPDGHGVPLGVPYSALSDHQRGLVARIQGDFPRTPSPVYGKEALPHAAAFAAAHQAAAVSQALDGPAPPGAEAAHLHQAMRALNLQHGAPPVPHPNGPHGLSPQPHHAQMQMPMQSFPMYGGMGPKVSMAPLGVVPQASGWPEAQAMMPQGPNALPNPMQGNYYPPPPPPYGPAAVQGYGPSPYGDVDVNQGYYGGFGGAPQPMHVSLQRPLQQGGLRPGPPPPAGPPHGSPLDKPKKGGRRDRAHEDAPRTRLMEEFRNVKTRRWEIQDLVGHMVEFSRDQEGSRLIQRKLESCSDPEKELVFAEVYKEALGLMTDVFGNYVIQKLFEHGLPRHRKMLACVLKGNVLSLTLQTYGCRVIQKALEVIDEDDQVMVSGELDGHVLRCVLDQNGNHVIQKCIERIPPQNVIFIVQSFVGNVQNLAVHAYGCRVIQRILEYCEDHSDVISPILDEILENVHILARDQYGNYVVQHVLINGKPLYQAAIIERLRPDSLELAQHKFASNVVEKMYHYGTREDKDAILSDLLTVSPDGASALHVMMRDQYANYVVQKIIDLSDDDQRWQIIEHIRPHIATLRRYTYGKHIIARIEKLSAGGKGGLPLQ